MNTDPGTFAESKHPETSSIWVDDERWALALRIASSRCLLKAAQLREILLYVCQRVLNDPSTVIREYEIGCSVLGRRPDFNPNDDNIVRVQISHLRKKLDEYFSSEGQAETLILSIPKGSYVPRFAPRINSVVDPEPKLPLAAPPPVPTPVKPAHISRLWFWRIGALTLALLVAGALALYRRQSPLFQPRRDHLSENLVWTSIFNSSSPLSIVVADSCLSLLQDTLGTDISLADYIGGHYPESLLAKVQDEPLRHTLTALAARQYTSLGDAEIASGLMNLGQRMGVAGSIHYARHMNIRNFQNGNFVLIGSRRGNPWVGLFEPELNFSLTENQRTHLFYFHNKDPRSGEPSDYVPLLNGDSILESYADIALVPNLGKTGYVLMFNGITMETSEAAGQLLMRQDFPPALNKVIRNLGASSPHYLEILVRVRSLGGAASNSEVIAYREHSS
jgi:hypothetical protein